jgi:hypothetical protein
VNPKIHALIPVALIAAGAFYGFHRSPDAATATTVATSIPEAVQYRGTADVKYKKPADNTWYECGRLTVPAGTWRLSYRVMAFSQRFEKDTGTVSAFARLTSDGSTDPDLMVGGRIGGNSFRGIWTLSTEKVVSLAVPATYVLAISESEGNNWSDLQCLGERSTTVIRAERLS